MDGNKNLQSSQVIAKVFDVSTRRVEQLKTEGVIKGEGKPTKYDLLPTIQAYIKYLSDKAYGREKKEKDSNLETEKLEAETRIKQAKAEKEELGLKELRGELHRAADVESIVTDSALYMRSLLMALPGQLAVDLSKMDNPAEISARIRDAVYFVLNEMAEHYDYDPEKYAERLREREGLKLEAADE